VFQWPDFHWRSLTNFSNLVLFLKNRGCLKHLAKLMFFLLFDIGNFCFFQSFYFPTKCVKVLNVFFSLRNHEECRRFSFLGASITNKLHFFFSGVLSTHRFFLSTSCSPKKRTELLWALSYRYICWVIRHTVRLRDSSAKTGELITVSAISDSEFLLVKMP